MTKISTRVSTTISGFVICVSSFFPFVHDEFVPIGIAELRHPTNRRLGLFNVERNPAFFKLRDGGIDVLDFESNRCPITRRFPSRLTTNSDRSKTELIVDPRAVQ